jgi:hypothetical protein
MHPGGYSFAGLANGTYAMTPSKTGFNSTPANQTVTVKGTNVTGVNFTAKPAIAIDAKVFADRGTASTTVATSAFSTTAGNELLLAFISTHWTPGPNTTVTGITGAGLTGVDTSGTNGSGAIGATGTGNASSGAPTASLVTTRNNSWVFGVGNDYDNAIARTPGSGQSLVHQFLTPVGDTYWVQMRNAPTPASGTTVPINDTAPTTDRYNLTICEILPAP